MNIERTFTKLLFTIIVFSFSVCASAEIYQWKDDSGRIHYSDKQPEAHASDYRTLSTSPIPAFIKLDVPLIKQGKNLCGPATIEMLFRYWGVDEYDQYDIAYDLLLQFDETKRVQQSGVLKTTPIDWNLYPGTGTINMREFLKRFAAVENPKIKKVSSSKFKADEERNKLFMQLKQNISQGIPVIVHQYWSGIGSRGHYRLVTGYDDIKREVYLNDSTQGKAVVQSYDKFLALWNVDKPWLHYNAIVFNTIKRPLSVELEKYEKL